MANANPLLPIVGTLVVGAAAFAVGVTLLGKSEPATPTPPAPPVEAGREAAKASAEGPKLTATNPPNAVRPPVKVSPPKAKEPRAPSDPSYTVEKYVEMGMPTADR